MSGTSFLSLTWKIQLALKMAELAVQKIYGPQARLLQSTLEHPEESAHSCRVKIKAIVFEGEGKSERHDITCYIRKVHCHPTLPIATSCNVEKESLRRTFEYIASVRFVNDLQII